MTIAIIGTGNVGSALAKGLKESGQEVVSVGKDPAEVRRASEEAHTIVLAVPFGAVQDVVKTAGSAWAGKTVIDVTNALTEDMQLALGYTTSGAEELQKVVPQAHVVKAFNGIFAQHMSTGQLNGQQLTTFVAADDEDAKQQALELAKGIGFDAVDAGPLQNARLLEPLGYFNIQLGYVIGMGPDIGFHLRH
ncbi:MAG: NADPH-dependent F420 reductase [Thermoplasmatota archaeon]